MRRVRRSLTLSIAALTACAATALTLGVTGPAAAHESGTTARTADEPSLTGSGKLKRRPGDDVHFTFDAHGFAEKAHGTFYVSHHMGKDWGGYFKGRIDCLLTGGPVAVATGVVTEESFKGVPSIGDIRGKRFGFTVLDGGPKGTKDRLGYSWALDGLPKNSVAKCLGSAPFETLERGDFTVHHWMPSRGR
ncbi:hypothetical protein [Streptomyces orinoci]|uniref:Repetin n=1 Tax=Streptomyces orinoci TaxID=67339 RepID=A0ABV3K6E5_STRON|nr:hypothetical protein [Streptomyces orinoci]